MLNQTLQLVFRIIPCIVNKTLNNTLDIFLKNTLNPEPDTAGRILNNNEPEAKGRILNNTLNNKADAE